ncbi:MAG: asparagine synthase (glutamine-hydrolyzing) [Saprospiraceae bacterium]|nr:asparagine synthase (glutamine-hydrolyzing) [Saprospiraceae bacterium]
MCGITGIFNVNGSPVSINTLKKMTDVIKHRGPDGEGFWTDSFIGFGHRRLAIIDLSPLGHQPMQTEDGNYFISYNGEVYNFQNIRIELEAKGYHFRSKTDSEVVLKSYREWGKDCVHKFNGMFAFAIWDKLKNKLFIARDRYGIKPLYYYYKNGTFLFGSEIKAILQHPMVSVDVSIPALNEYFSFQNIFSDLTLFNEIKLLPAAHTISIKLADQNSFKMDKYWDYNFQEDNSIDETEALEELNRLFEQAVNRQLISDVEVGSYLSGGIDSGAITCVAANNFTNLKTFTAGFDLSSASGLELAFDERGKSEFLSNLYKTEHYEVVLKAGDMERVMPELIWHLEDPRVGQSYPNYYVSRLASKFVKVVLSGAGGDELFAGYPWRYYRAVINDDFEHYIEKYYKYWLRLIPDRFKPDFYNSDIYPEILNYQTRDVFRKVFDYEITDIHSPEEYVNHSLYFESKTFLHGLLLVDDKLSMAHSLESRVPFLDNDLVDFAMKLPVNLKLKNLTDIIRINENEPGPKSSKYFEKTNDGKIILRNALTKYVPRDYANGIKQGFSAPDASWFKGESIDYIKALLMDKSALIYNYLQPKKINELMNEHFEGGNNRRLLIWSLLNFEWWLKTFYK